MGYNLTGRTNVFFTAVIIGYLILTPTLFAESATQVTPTSKIFIEDLKGEVQITKAGSAQAQIAIKGDVLNPDDKIQTGDNASAKIMIEGTGELTLKGSTTWSYGAYSKTEDKTTFSAYLALGRLKAKVQKLPKDSVFEIKTPTSVAAVRGTGFGLFVYMVAQQYFTQLEVFENAVAFSNLTGDQTQVINEGQNSIANEAGTVTPPQAIESKTDQVLSQATPEESKSDKESDNKNKAPGGNPPGGGGPFGGGNKGPTNVPPGSNPFERGELKPQMPDSMPIQPPEPAGPPESMFSPENFAPPEPIAQMLPGQTNLQQQTTGSQSSPTGAAPGVGPQDTMIIKPPSS